ncbi:PLP-dependent cysteine synthase family protein [Dactylosporangium fulvum]|uniref:Pyridoxal-phosphate dependent enzyme n=1 Tax=Dactylosporangium fulvum TaxID=53359 RepID=A0ABY5VTZ2_9ACTN|nr:pyridoxal-phosphate dependent enzyme [Dactylosporangium fulvum]UWP80586.1 pyridoxal-phosphate dependent enzyme [Dactylosporangium fulvum]
MITGKSPTRWAASAIEALSAEAEQAGETRLVPFPVPGGAVRLFLKDESAQPTGSLKHRAARAMFRHAIASGRITEGTTVVEATGGTAAVAQAYFARLLGLPYIAVMPGTPDPRRAATVEALGGRCEFVTPPLAIYAAARRLATEAGGHYLDQFTAAERALDWRGDSLAGELFAQVERAAGRAPDWVVVGAGTGATSASLGRHIRYHGLPTLLTVVDPEHSAYFPGWASGTADYATGMPSRIEGIGRPRMEPGFVPSLADVVMPVPDAASVAGARAVRAHLGLPVGGSTGANLIGALFRAAQLRDQGGIGSVVTLVCDAADRHLGTYHDDGWAVAKGLDPAPYAAAIDEFLAGGRWRMP